MKKWQAALCLFALIAPRAYGEITELTWPLGENVCIGTWTYDEMASCGQTDFSQPIYGDVLTYPDRDRECRSWRFGEEVVGAQTKTIAVSNRSSVHDLPSVQEWCRYNAKNLEVGPERDGTPWSNPDVVWRKLVLRSATIDGSTGICEYDEVVQVKKRDPSCGQEPDTSKPQRNIVGYKTATIINRSCGVTTKTLPQGSDLKPILNLPTTDRASALCSTGDEQKLDNADDFKEKAAILNKEMVASLRLDATYCPYKRNLAEYTNLLLAQENNGIAAGQQSLLKTVAQMIFNKCLN